MSIVILCVCDVAIIAYPGRPISQQKKEALRWTIFAARAGDRTRGRDLAAQAAGGVARLYFRTMRYTLPLPDNR
jgi:hypothetical protein